MGVCIFFFKQKTAYEMRISDWSSDVCSSDLVAQPVDCPPSHARNTRNRTGAGSAVRAFHLRRHDRRLCAPRRLRYAVVGGHAAWIGARRKAADRQSLSRCKLTML